MDFASLMSAQIAKASPVQTSKSTEGQPSKYIKRSELEARRQQEYLAAQKEAESLRQSKLEKKRQREDQEALEAQEREEKRIRLAEHSRKIKEQEDIENERARRKRLGLPELSDPSAGGDRDASSLQDGEVDLEDSDLVVKLREMNQPVRLFDESHTARLRRYRRLVDAANAPKLSSGPIPTTLELVPETEMKVPDTVPSDAEGRKYVYRQLASYFTMVLSEWIYALNQRDAETKMSTSGIQAYNAMVQARTNMIPLFRRFEKGDLDDSILDPIVEIVQCCQRRRYVDANDAYLRLSIGKAAWPIGVTMVGIHERSAREKLHSHDKDAAHIMSDEVTRKFLQSIKRCLSFAQTRWPPDDGGWA